ncbi:MAG: metalloregulator ArsR/SmtB family transcription factor [Candidatus Dojkabacteria bacterium]
MNSTNTMAFGMLSDETRLSILNLVSKKAMNVKSIVEAIQASSSTNTSQPTVSHHLNLLRMSGLVNSQREGRSIFYSINHEKLSELKNEIDTILSTKPQKAVKTARRRPAKTVAKKAAKTEV